MNTLSKIYDPKKNEEKIYKYWEDSGKFNPNNLDLPKNAPTYTIVLPPPNITDKLHLGHSSMIAIEDLLIRYHRMQGFKTLWIPGTDHAAIATQNVVEKKLLKEKNQTRHDLGREKFMEEAWAFMKTTQSTILNQTRRMGASLDWSRLAFTLDEPRKKAVEKMFIDMYKAGAIYRGERMVNWCSRCHSTLADDEVEHQEKKAKLYWIKYGPFVLATSRPETKLGDTAVAVHPSDERYQKMIGKDYEIEGVLGKFMIKVVADKSVDPSFGSGAVKVTPAHSFTDSEIAARHNLPSKKIINEDGRMMDNCGKYAGMSVLEARKAIVTDMETLGLIDHIDEDYQHSAAVCYRCGTVIEPLPSKQWFISVDKKLDRLDKKSLKEAALEVSEEKQIEFIPDRFTKRYEHWMKNLHDWCISRQIWLGHRIPAWHKNGAIKVQAEKPKENTNFIFLHGFYRTGEVKDPLNWLNKKLPTKNNFWKILPKANKPSYREQSKFVLENSTITNDSIFVTHSLGGTLAMKMIEENNLKIKKLILLAPVFNTKNIKAPELQNYLETKIDFEKLKTLVDEIIILKPQKDHIVPEEDFDKLAQKLNTKIIQIEKSKSHFNNDQNELIFNEIKNEIWTQDPDTLDTWFSSGMWTFSTLGWPDNFQDNQKSGDLAQFHPTQVLNTGYEILTLWVSRMIMMSLFAVNEIPFEKVHLHGMVLDQNGKKMSKSKGNGIDPIDMIEKYGTDAVRLSLLIGSTAGNDVKISERKIESCRNFINKIWNISRFVLNQVETTFKDISSLEEKDLTLADKWILSEMHHITKNVRSLIENHEFSAAGELLRYFIKDNFADWYLEISKIEKNNSKQIILSEILKDLLKLWHPFIPFITETIWQKISDSMLMTENLPKKNKYQKYFIPDQTFPLIKNIIIEIRNARAQYQLNPNQKIKVVLQARNKTEILTKEKKLLENLGTFTKEIKIVENGDEIANAFFGQVSDIRIYIPLEGIVDLEKEIERLTNEVSKLKNIRDSMEKKLSNKKFVENAPKEIIEKEQLKKEQLKIKIKNLEKQLRAIK